MKDQRIQVGCIWGSEIRVSLRTRVTQKMKIRPKLPATIQLLYSKNQDQPEASHRFPVTLKETENCDKNLSSLIRDHYMTQLAELL